MDSDGKLVVKYNQDAWGYQVSITDTSMQLIGQRNPFRYKGYYYETALLDFGKKTAFLIAAGTVGYTFLPTITTGITRGISNFIGNWIGDRF